MNKGILVIGDIMLDKYIYGSCDRLSPEAPIPVVDFSKEKTSLGGAANVANNVVCLGRSAYLIGLVGTDPNAKILRNLVNNNDIENHIISSQNVLTTTKTRVLGNNQQICRIDKEFRGDRSDNVEADIEYKLNKLLPKIKIIIISDYDKGMLSKAIISKICKYADKYEIDVLVDPKFLDWNKYNGVKYITPNFKEFSFAVGKKISNNNDNIEKYGRKLLNKFRINNIIVTRAEKGISLVMKNEVIHFPTSTKKVYDVTGAGDTVIATISFCLLMGLELKDSIFWANKAASVVIRKIGANPITIEDLRKIGFNE
jgi:rfaE bifunctional protein kinase chain/domain